MRTILFIAFALSLFASLASAQAPTSGNVFFGYSYYNTDLSTLGRTNTNGWEASLEGRIAPFLGIVADFDGHYGSQNFVASNGPLSANVSEDNVLFGRRVSFSAGKFRPFAEGMIGVGHVNANAAGSNTSFATALGGGLDYRIIRPIAWRFQGDYVSTRFFGATQNNVRLSTGIVLRF
ncbi:MAG TPA: hypothetical protein VMD99_01715 [Terriglobales bacterium]|nr:hypothetical protein [Terriglobales bacterium]